MAWFQYIGHLASDPVTKEIRMSAQVDLPDASPTLEPEKAMRTSTTVHRSLTFAALTLVTINCTATNSGTPSSERYDILLRGGTVVDGSGAPRFTADVAIRGERIAAVGRSGLDPTLADKVIDVSGKAVTPGFVDNHAHIQTTIHQYPLAENFTRQGITTIVASLHSGDVPWPLDEYIAALDVAPNVAFFAGHTWARRQVLGMDNRDPSGEELQQMRDLIDQAMQQGAIGLSTGLLYVPANYAKTEEVIELAKVASRYGGIYYTHMRDEGRGLLASVAEAIRIGREAEIPVQIQHHKAMGVAQFGWSANTLAMIDSANASGLDVRHDLYPYTAGSTGSSVIFPPWALAGGQDSLVARVSDPAVRPQVEEGMRDRLVNEWVGDDLNRIQFRTVPSAPEFDGKTLADYAAAQGLPNTVASGIQMGIELQLAGGFSAIYHVMDEGDVQRIMRHPLATFQPDGDPVGYGEGFPHPRSYGAFPRVLARSGRDLGVLTLEEAIHKMTRLSMDRLGQAERGSIAEGMIADLVVFDPETIQDNADYVQPHQFSTGIETMIINGTLVIDGMALTGERPGTVLTRPETN